jgi:hypothetical protein
MICAFGILVQQVMKRGRNGQGAYAEQQTKHHADGGDFADAQLQRCCQPALHGYFISPFFDNNASLIFLSAGRD